MSPAVLVPPPCPKPTVLISLPKRARGIVIEHRTDPATAERLAALGLGVGARFSVLQIGKRLTVLVGESRIALGAELGASVWALAR